MNRFYLPSERFNFSDCFPLPDQLNHIRNVLRLKEKDKFIIFNEKGKEYVVEIVAFKKNKIVVNTIEERNIVSEPSKFITLCQALPKGQKMDTIIRFATELGVKKIVPITSERTIPKPDKNKQMRWQRIAKTSSQQCGRSNIPEITNIYPLSEVKHLILQHNLSLLFSEKETTSLKSVLKNKKDIEKILVLIGPEGAFSEEEENFLKSAGVISASLGKRIFRCETAALVALSIILYHFEGEDGENNLS